MYSLLAEKIIYPLSDVMLGTSVMRYYHWLQKTQWWSPEQLQELQNTKLRLIVKHAFKNVPYYQRIFRERGLTDRDIQTIEDLPKLPILTKADIRQNLQEMLAKDFKRWKPIQDATGGSTGEPLKYYITKDFLSIIWAAKFRGFGWGGYKIGDKRIKFAGSSLIPNEAPSLLEVVRNKLERNLALSAVILNDAKYAKIINTINSYKPKFIYGYPSSIFLLADYCRSNKIDTVHFDAVFCTAEVLLPNFREGIEKQFQCKVFDHYGSYDGGAQALECGLHQGFHISVEKVILEIVDGNGQKLPPGKSGRTIVTDLYNYAMPFIRYDVGDIGVLSDKQCDCGRGLPLLKTIEGRTPDIIRFSNGIILSGAAVPCMFKDCPIKQFQLIQIAKDELLLKIVKDTDYSELDTKFILNTLEHHAGQEIKIRLEFCDEIPVLQNGKYRFIISKS
jgi:phenylacetate-CoA ligase